MRPNEEKISPKCVRRGLIELSIMSKGIINLNQGCEASPFLNTTIFGEQWGCSLHRNKASFSRMRASIVMPEGDLRSSMLR